LLYPTVSIYQVRNRSMGCHISRAANGGFGVERRRPFAEAGMTSRRDLAVRHGVVEGRQSTLS